MKEARSCMEYPYDSFGLSNLLGKLCFGEFGFLFLISFCYSVFVVHLDVDAKSADSWYKAK
jgi:hypothetical protein